MTPDRCPHIARTITADTPAGLSWRCHICGTAATNQTWQQVLASQDELRQRERVMVTLRLGPGPVEYDRLERCPLCGGERPPHFRAHYACLLRMRRLGSRWAWVSGEVDRCP